MKWSKERDELIAQTKAFVQSVTGRTPPVAPKPVSVESVPVKPIPIENPFVALVSSPAANASVENFVPVDPAATVEKASDLPPAPAQSDIRKEIQTRVAAFQAHQHRFHRERDTYFNSVLTKARAGTGNGPDASTDDANLS